MELAVQFARVQITHKLEKATLLMNEREVGKQVHVLETVNSNDGTIFGAFAEVLQGMRELNAIGM